MSHILSWLRCGLGGAAFLAAALGLALLLGSYDSPGTATIPATMRVGSHVRLTDRMWPQVSVYEVVTGISDDRTLFAIHSDIWMSPHEWSRIEVIQR